MDSRQHLEQLLPQQPQFLQPFLFLRPFLSLQQRQRHLLQQLLDVYSVLIECPIAGATVYLIEAKSGGNNGVAIVEGREIDPSIGNEPTKDSSAHIVANAKTDKEGNYLY